MQRVVGRGIRIRRQRLTRSDNTMLRCDIHSDLTGRVHFYVEPVLDLESHVHTVTEVIYAARRQHESEDE
jgi:hypothetical protein